MSSPYCKKVIKEFEPLVHYQVAVHFSSTEVIFLHFTHSWEKWCGEKWPIFFCKFLDNWGLMVLLSRITLGKLFGVEILLLTDCNYDGEKWDFVTSFWFEVDKSSSNYFLEHSTQNLLGKLFGEKDKLTFLNICPENWSNSIRYLPKTFNEST